MKWIKLLLINYCANRALKYELKSKVLNNNNGLNHIYAIGAMVHSRDKWINRIDKLCGK